MRPPVFLARPAAVVAAASLVGCTNLAALSSGHVGCVESDIEVTGDSHSGNVRTWTATCHGKSYACSSANDHPLDSGVGQVSCRPQFEDPPRSYAKPRPRTSAPAETTGPGCKNDLECKGDRVCRKGSCEDPTRGPAPAASTSASASGSASAVPASNATPATTTAPAGSARTVKNKAAAQ